MSKNLLALLLASGTFSIALLLANSSSAAPIISDNAERIISSYPVIPSLSLINSSANWSEQQNPILHSLGCSCSTCTQPSTSKISIGS